MRSEKTDLSKQAIFVPNTENSKNGDYEIPLVHVEPICNQEYEDVSYNVAKSADLNLVSSRSRHKKNQLDGKTKHQQVPLPDKPSWPNDGTKSSSLEANSQPGLKELKMWKYDKKLVIFFAVMLCFSLVALALGVVNLLNEQRQGMGLCNYAYKKMFLAHTECILTRKSQRNALINPWNTLQSLFLTGLKFNILK